MPDSPEASRAEHAALLARRLAGRARRAVGDATAHREPAAPRDPGTPVAPRPAPPADDAGTRRKDEVRRARHQHRLASAVLGKDAVGSFHDDFDLGPDELAATAATARRARASSAFGDLLAQGHPVRVAHVATVRALCDAGLRPAARAFALGTAGLPDGDALGRIGAGLVLHSMAELSRPGVSSPGWTRPCWPSCCPSRRSPAPSSRARTTLSPWRGRWAARGVVRRGHARRTGRALPRPWLGRPARSLVDEADARPAAERTGRAGEMLALLHRWTHPRRWASRRPARSRWASWTTSRPTSSGPRATSATTCRPWPCSATSPASAARLPRGRRPRRAGDQPAGPDPARARLPGGDAASPHPVSRDFSTATPSPDTWMIAFGWHMMPTFRIGSGCPTTRTSTRSSSPSTSTASGAHDGGDRVPQAHGPVGCRDWTTVDLLLSAGVDAFFTGCLTTTVSAVFPERGDVEDVRPRVVGAVDLTPAGWSESGRASRGRPRRRGVPRGEPGDRGAAAIDLLGLPGRYHRVVTSRLHSYLPATSLGIPPGSARGSPATSASTACWG